MDIDRENIISRLQIAAKTLDVTNHPANALAVRNAIDYLKAEQQPKPAPAEDVKARLEKAGAVRVVMDATQSKEPHSAWIAPEGTVDLCLSRLTPARAEAALLASQGLYAPYLCNCSVKAVNAALATWRETAKEG